MNDETIGFSLTQTPPSHDPPPRRRHRRRRCWPRRITRTSARGPRSRRLRVRRRSWRRLDLLRHCGVRSPRPRPQPPACPLQPLRFPPNQYPQRIHGILRLPLLHRCRRHGDRRRFPGHREVRRYLEDFARDFDLMGLIRFWTRVVCVEIEGDGRWKVVWRQGGGGVESEVFDAVVVCVGHYSEPRVAEIPGIESWPGRQIHSHNYRVPDPLRDQVVVIIGNSASAADISKDIADFAKEVHIVSRSSPAGAPLNEPGYDNVWLHSMIERAHIDGTVLFQDGSLAHVDVIMHCTGYKYHFPFLKTNGIVTVDDNRSKWVAGVLSERILLPTKEEMTADVESLYSEMESSGWPKRYTHNITNYHFEYVDWLANQCRFPPVEQWRKLMYYANRKNRAANPVRYRDEWDDDDLVIEAHEHFKNSQFLGHDEAPTWCCD